MILTNFKVNYRFYGYHCIDFSEECLQLEILTVLTGFLLDRCFDDVTGGFCENTPGSASDLPIY